MKTHIIKIGNSRGIRIPKALINQCGFVQDVHITIRNNELIITSPHKNRDSWENDFKRMAQHKDDKLIIDDNFQNTFDNKNWTW